MSQYIHHVPGRLRVRSDSFLCRSGALGSAQDRLMSMDGVTHVRINPRAGSITVNYEPARIGYADLMTALRDVGCVGEGATKLADGESRPQSGRVVEKAGEMFGRALLGAFVKKAVEHSALRVVSVLL